MNKKSLGRAVLAPVILTTAAAAAATATLTTLGRAARGLPTAIGAGRAEIRPAAEGSPHFTGDTFHNTEPSHVLAPGEMTSMIPALIRHRGVGKPSGTIPLVTDAPPRQAGRLDITWFGHATTLTRSTAAMS